ncbi:MAG: LptF/LptG family permease [Bacteroidales bacterium]
MEKIKNKLKIIDVYIIGKFLGTFFYAITLLAIIIIIFDISEKIDDFLEREAPLRAIIFDYYLNFLPYFINLFSALFTFIAVIFFTSRMAANTEIIAILNSGISFWRLLRPYMISALILALLSFYLTNFLIPITNRKMVQFESKYIKSQSRASDMNIHMQISPGTFIYVESYNKDARVGYRFSLEKMNEKGLFYKLSADYVTWDSIKQQWKADMWVERTIKDMHETLINGRSKLISLPLLPKDFSINVEDTKVMNYSELRRFIAREKMRGSSTVAKFEVVKYTRIAWPFATIVLTIIGVALSSRKVRGGTGLNLGLGLSISFAFILFMQFFSVFAIFGNIPPIIAVWIPNVLFGLLGVYLLRMSPK